MPMRKKYPPGPGPLEVYIRAPFFASDYIRAHHFIKKNWGNFPSLLFGNKRLYYFFRPDLVSIVLRDKQKHFVKSFFYEELRPLVGRSILLSEGEEWKKQRRTVAPVFHKDAIDSYQETMKMVTESYFKDWKKTPFEIDVEPEMLKLALQIVGESIFGMDLREIVSKIGNKFLICLAHANWRMQLPIPPPRWLPTPGALREARTRRELAGLVQSIIESRRADKDVQKRQDILSRLLCAVDPDLGGLLTPENVMDQALTFLAAGHDTTSSALTWTLYLLAKHPEHQERVRAEVASSQTGTWPFLTQCIQESLRVYPPAPAFSRDVAEPFEVDGYTLQKGAIVIVNVHVLHHDPNHWPNPEVFDPERFNSSATSAHTPFSYIPFSAGPRGCIGEGFAMSELKIVLAHLLAKYRVVVPQGFTPEMKPSITLRTKKGMRLRFEPV